MTFITCGQFDFFPATRHMPCHNGGFLPMANKGAFSPRANKHVLEGLGRPASGRWSPVIPATPQRIMTSWHGLHFTQHTSSPCCSRHAVRLYCRLVPHGLHVSLYVWHAGPLTCGTSLELMLSITIMMYCPCTACGVHLGGIPRRHYTSMYLPDEASTCPQGCRYHVDACLSAVLCAYSCLLSQSTGLYVYSSRITECC